MIITRHNKNLYTWKKWKLTKNEMIKKNKENKSSKLENKNYEDLGYKSRLC